MTASEKVREFALYHAIGDLPHSSETTKALLEAVKILEAKEKGRIIELPVPLETTVYYIPYGETAETHKMEIWEVPLRFWMADPLLWNIWVFATKEEAEKRLEELKNDSK